MIHVKHNVHFDYGLFALSVLWVWWYAKKERKKFEKNAVIYEKLYDETLKMVYELEKKVISIKHHLMIVWSDEHL